VVRLAGENANPLHRLGESDLELDHLQSEDCASWRIEVEFVVTTSSSNCARGLEAMEPFSGISINQCDATMFA
jgi:hypothetical protein